MLKGALQLPLCKRCSFVSPFEKGGLGGISSLAVRFEAVHFSYEAGRDALRGLNLEFPLGNGSRWSALAAQAKPRLSICCWAF
ncbi:hypothetical protein [Chromatium okenii]|uniref:hypothetical protein n=1 Tax=Chromatium okenii TaxID=61644 RepID=UPI003D6C1EEB